MEINEKFHQIAELYLKHTSLSKNGDVDVSDLKNYIKHAIENGLIYEKEIRIRDCACSDH